MTRKAVIYIACSLDGIIAGPNDDLTFLNRVQKEGEDYGYGKFISGIDTVVLGRKTYDWVMAQVPEFPHADKECYVLTRSPRNPIGNTIFYTGNPALLIDELKHKEGKDIFIDGGAQVVQALLNAGKVDDLIVSFIPVLLGRGTYLFAELTHSIPLKLIRSEAYDTGLVQVHYRIEN